ncbi:MAG: type II secretion system F family protein [Candidatus Omnitrophica bacterium]|nr:type II secretion system F family protein [Candidatus Omnitrophota bacterium]
MSFEDLDVRFQKLVRRFGGRAKPRQLVQFTRQLATLVGAGLPLVRSLNTLTEQVDAGPLKEAVCTIRDEVESGTSFSEALSQYPRIFGNLYVSMIRAGEIGGQLDLILKRLADLLEKSDRLRRRVKSAMMYPIFVLAVAFLILLLLMVYVVPTFIKMFSELGGALPTPTRILILMSEMIRHRWWVLVVVFALLFVFWAWAAKLPAVRFWIDKTKLKLPGIGRFVRQVAVARFARTLGTLLASGVPILKGLDVASQTVGNRQMEVALEEVARSIKEGESIAGPLEASGVFEPIVVRMVSVGEETGKLDEMLARVADSFEEEVDVSVSGITSILEPLLIVSMAVIVGFIVIAMFLPMFTLAKLIQ